MSFVEIYKLENNGDQRVIAVCRLVPEGVTCEGDAVFVKNLEEGGVRDYSDSVGERKSFPSDGMKFLENLKYAFKSGYLSATDVLE